MSQANELLIGAGPDGQPVGQAWRLANRHGLIAGATGTGKTVTLQHLAESFSDAGVAVFAADIKGDLCGIAAPGNPQGKVAERIASMPWLNYQPKAYPTTLWDIAGKTGHPLRTTISEMGPLLLANLLELTDSQQAALFAAFQVADREGLLLLDLKDLKALLNHLKDNPEILGEDRALFTGASGQALLRRLATLEQQGAEAFFGEPALQLEDILRPEPDGRGRIHLLDASRLVHEAPKVYATFLLWLLAELFEQLPERGDADKPVLALFFDEAHLLFNGTPKALRDRLEQVVRLIRSKGVGVYFVTQSPGDLPDDVLAQLGLRIQHGLRAFTAKEQKSLRAVADGFRPNPAFDTLGGADRTGYRRGAGRHPGGKGHAGHGPARRGGAALFADRPAERQRTRRTGPAVAVEGALRPADRSRVGLRGAGEQGGRQARGAGPGACTAGKRVRRRRHGRADSRQPAVQFDGEERHAPGGQPVEPGAGAWPARLVDGREEAALSARP
ncbi:ATPase [Pseudomonas aeruginosa]|nr:ATPase [Pseudomonas aeruginosa]